MFIPQERMSVLGCWQNTEVTHGRRRDEQPAGLDNPGACEVNRGTAGPRGPAVLSKASESPLATERESEVRLTYKYVAHKNNDASIEQRGSPVSDPARRKRDARVAFAVGFPSVRFFGCLILSSPVLLGGSREMMRGEMN